MCRLHFGVSLTLGVRLHAIEYFSQPRYNSIRLLVVEVGLTGVVEIANYDLIMIFGRCSLKLCSCSSCSHAQVAKRRVQRGRMPLAEDRRGQVAA